MTPPVLVLGYGNTLRGDDAAGPAVATALQELDLPAIDARPCHQLTPELAAPLAQANLAIFIDASIHPHSNPTCTHLKPALSTTQPFAHACSPQTLLRLALELYGHAPNAWLIQIPASSFNLGDPLSPACAAALPQAVHLATLLATPLLTPPPGNGK